MQKSLFFVICVVATFAIIEAVPWVKKISPKTYDGVPKSDNRGDTDFGVEEFLGGNGGNTNVKSGGGLRREDRYNQDAGENQDNGEGVLEQGGDGYQGGRGLQGGRGYPGSRGSQGGSRNTGGRGSPVSPGASSGRRSQRPTEDNESGDNSDEYIRKPKYGCRGCRVNNIGNGYNNKNSVYFHSD